MKQRILQIISVFIIITGIFMIGGCSVTPEERATAEKQEDQSAIVPTINKAASYDSYWGPYYDYSGQVEITYYLKSTYGVWNTITATVPDDSVCIGGGAFTDYDSNPGFLTGSWPGSDLKSWNAQSKDHCYYGYHRLTAVAFGMRLKDTNGNYIPVSDVISHFRVYSNTSPANSISESSTVSVNYELISGGSQVLNPFSNVGQLLTDNHDSAIFSWDAASKAHVYEDLKQVVSYAIGYDYNIIPNFGSLQIIRDSSTTNISSSTAGCVILQPISGWVLSAVGGYAISYNSSVTAGRLLTSVGVWKYPSGLYAFVKDTDFIYPTVGQLSVYIRQIQKDKRGEIKEGNYYIRNQWTGEYLSDTSRSDKKISVGSTIQSWHISPSKYFRKYYYIQNNVTGSYMTNDKLSDYNTGDCFEFWRYSSDPGIQNATDPYRWFAIGGFDGNHFLQVENRLGYVESTTRRNLNPDWWSKNWSLDPAN